MCVFSACACVCVCVCACACVGLFVNICVCVGSRLLPFWPETVAILPQDSRLFEPPSIVDDFDNADADADSLARRSSSSGDRAHEHPILCGSLTYRRLSWSEAMVRMNLSADRRDDDEDALGGHSDIDDDDDDDDV